MKQKTKATYFSLACLLILIITGCTKTTEIENPPPPSMPTTPVTPVNNPTVTDPATLFLSSQDYTASSAGAYWTQQFTISTATSFVFRFTSQYQAQASIITPDQLNNFQTNKSFTGFALFDKTVGTNFITLAPGTYYVALRNVVTSANKWSCELDYAVTLPASDKATFLDNYVKEAKALAAGTRLWQPFSIEKGYRYFLDGCNVNCDVRIIPASQLAAFQNNQSFQYYTDYYESNGAAPGYYEVKLAAGNYYLVSYNSAIGALTYVMERWKIN